MFCVAHRPQVRPLANRAHVSVVLWGKGAWYGVCVNKLHHHRNGMYSVYMLEQVYLG